MKNGINVGASEVLGLLLLAGCSAVSGEFERKFYDIATNLAGRVVVVTNEYRRMGL